MKSRTAASHKKRAVCHSTSNEHLCPQIPLFSNLCRRSASDFLFPAAGGPQYSQMLTEPSSIEEGSHGTRATKSSRSIHSGQAQVQTLFPHGMARCRTFASLFSPDTIEGLVLCEVRRGGTPFDIAIHKSGRQIVIEARPGPDTATMHRVQCAARAHPLRVPVTRVELEDEERLSGCDRQGRFTQVPPHNCAAEAALIRFCNKSSATLT